ncbi:MAG: enoyl-CoA hydratase/isomerase family protein [Dehalococcoidia bacterium]|nr:enoyl-CoA hydratase/isomerase family protein [Dehalococcoidia bacterium]
MSSTATFECDRGLAVIRLAQDGLGPDLAAGLAAICDELNYDTEIRAAVITGSGPVFCGDSAPTRGEQPAFSLSAPVASLNCPLIAAVNGDAIGIGLELALACDIRIAAETARFSLPGIKRGLIPYDGATQRLPRLVGRARAIELMLTGDTISAAEALRIGLVSRVAPAKDVLNVAIEMGHEMAGKASWALRYCKEAVYKGLDMTLAQGLQLEGDIYFLLHTTEDRTEGIKAFKEKRKPTFKGK